VKKCRFFSVSSCRKGVGHTYLGVGKVVVEELVTSQNEDVAFDIGRVSPHQKDNLATKVPLHVPFCA
jgi:hypothetical protein